MVVTKRALEHDQPSFLLSLTIEKLFVEKIFRPGLSVLERLVLKAREEAVNETYRLLLPILDDETKANLNKLGENEKGKKQSNLVWLRQSAVSFSADTILQNTKKIKFLREMKVETWDLGHFTQSEIFVKLPVKAVFNRSNELVPKKRYPILADFC